MRTLRRASVATTATTALIVMVVGITAYRAMLRSTATAQWVTHTYQVQNALESLLTTIVDAETSARGFSATGSSTYRAPFDQAQADLPRELDVLDALTADNPTQQRDAAQLRAEATAAIDLIGQMMAHAESQRDIPRDLNDRERAGMDAVREAVHAMRSEEQRLMDQRTSAAANAVLLTKLSIVALFVLSVGVLAVSAFLVIRRAMMLDRANEDLASRVHERTLELQDALAHEQAARAKAQRANALKDEFLMTVSHELRTPLTAMYGWSRMLLEGNLSETQERRGIEAITRSAEAQTRIIDDLLDASRAMAGKLAINLRSVDLGGIIHAAVSAVRPAADAKALALFITIQHDLHVVGDADRLQQVIWNLLSNAIKFTPPGGRVDVTMRQVDDAAEITVTDTGQGIAAEFLPFVFDRFRQADATPSRAHGGLGLGLAIVRSIADLHGGRIDVESPGVNQGTTFRLRLPLSGPPGAVHVESRPSRTTATARRLDGVAILIVEDDTRTQEMLVTALESAGADVRTAASVAAAIGRIRGWTPAVVLADIGMPHEDGFALPRKIREIAGEDVHVIAVTAFTHPQDQQRALEHGFDRHLAKPIEPEGLLAAVASVLAGRPGRRVG